MKHGPEMKMYFLYKNGDIPTSYLSSPEGNPFFFTPGAVPCDPWLAQYVQPTLMMVDVVRKPGILRELFGVTPSSVLVV